LTGWRLRSLIPPQTREEPKKKSSVLSDTTCVPCVRVGRGTFTNEGGL
jgi:hypothetical protein